MKKIILDVDTIDLSYLIEALKMAKDLEIIENNLSTLEIVLPKEIVRYNLWHNKKSIHINSQRWDKGVTDGN